MHETDTGSANLRSVATSALRSGVDAVPHLQRLLRIATPESDDARFARRHLAEICVEENPWQTALHLRELERLGESDEVLCALGGLAHALLGNFRVAVARYREALRDSPRNPWYHHNIGHLLDFGLGEPTKALGHLRIAHGLEPNEPEIAASLATCLSRLGLEDEAREVACESLPLAHEDAEHQRILRQIAFGKAPCVDPDASAPLMQAQVEARSDGGSIDAVSKVLRIKMVEAGYGDTEIEVAHALWEEFCSKTQLRLNKPEVMAAAVEYTFCRHELRASPKRSEVARRYGVSAKSVASRATEIVEHLGLA